MKFLKWLALAAIPLALMVYGWYLGQLHMSGYDVAGIFLFLTGAAGFVLALLLRLPFRRFEWMERWWVNLIFGAVSCLVIFGLVLIAANIYK